MKRAVILALGSLMLLSSCGTFGEAYSETYISAYDRLTPVEQDIYDALTMNRNGFKDPTSVKIRDASNIPPDPYKAIFLYIMGKNSYGAYVSDWYFLIYEDFDVYLDESGWYHATKGTISKAINDPAGGGTDVSIERLNAAIEEGWSL